MKANWKFWQRHTVFTRGDYTIVVNHTWRGKIRDAGLYFRDAPEICGYTRDPAQIKHWVATLPVGNTP